MIYDGLDAIGRYRGIYRGLDVLIDWLATNSIHELALGKTELCGSKVFANVMDASTKLPADAHYETHRRYMDVQADIEGREAFRTTPGATLPVGEFDVAGDKGYCVAAPGNDDELAGTLDHGRFALFVIGEPHMPNLMCAGDEPGAIRKVCFKLLGDEFWEE